MLLETSGEAGMASTAQAVALLGWVMSSDEKRWGHAKFLCWIPAEKTSAWVKEGLCKLWAVEVYENPK